MKTFNYAKEAAHRMWLKTGKDYFVVFSKDEFDCRGNDYHVADEYDLDTYFVGLEPIYATADTNGGIF